MSYIWNSAEGKLYMDKGEEVPTDDADPQYQVYLEWLSNGNEVSVVYEPLNPNSPDPSVGKYESSESMSSSTSTLERSKVLLRTDLKTGFYRVSWSYSWAYSSTSSTYLAWVYVDDLPVHIHVEEPQDSSLKQLIPASGFVCLELSEGTHTFDLRWAASLKGQTACISQSRILVTEVKI